MENIYVSLDELVRLGGKAKGFSFLPRQPIHSLLSGRHGSKFRGRGMDFSELKPYVQGDDTRQIDWKATQRTRKPYIRLYNEERDRSVWVVLSQRNSMFFASKGAMKSVQAARAAALTLFRTLSVGDRVGGVIFNDSRLKSFRPQRSKTLLMQMLHEIVEQNGALHATNTGNGHGQLNQALKIVSASARHDDLVVLIGDGQGFDDETARYLSDVARHNDILAVTVYDPLENVLRSEGPIVVSDGEHFSEFDSSDKRFQKRFEASFQSHLQRLEQLSKRHNIVLMKLRTDEDLLTQIQQQLGYHPGSRR